MKIVIIDNYDSFVYNLSHAIKELGAEVTVKRNDQFQLEELEEFDKILAEGTARFALRSHPCTPQ